MELEFVEESLVTVLINYDSEEIDDYDEVVAGLTGLCTYSQNRKKLDLALKNRESVPAKQSIEEPQFWSL